MRVPTYHAQSLRSVSADFTYRGIENKVILQAKIPSKGEIQHIFGEQGHELSKSLEVIYISAHNLGNVSYTFSPADIDLVMIPYKDVVKSMKTSSIGGLASGIVCTGTAYAAFCPAVLAMIMNCPMIIVYVGLASGIVIANVGFTYFGKSIKSMIMNSRIAKDVKAKIFDKAVMLNSSQQYDGLVVIKKQNYTPTFSIKMHEQDAIDSTIVFGVELKQNQ